MDANPEELRELEAAARRLGRALDAQAATLQRISAQLGAVLQTQVAREADRAVAEALDRVPASSEVLREERRRRD